MTGATAVATAVHRARTSSSEGPSETHAAARPAPPSASHEPTSSVFPQPAGAAISVQQDCEAGGQPRVQPGTGHQMRGQRHGELAVRAAAGGVGGGRAATAVSHPWRMRPGHPDAPTMSEEARRPT